MQSDIESAILAADQGDLRLAARLSRAMLRDGTYAGIMATRAGGLTRLPKIFRGTPSVVDRMRALDDVSIFDRIYAPKELELLNADGISIGVGVGEHLPVPGQAEPVFVRLDPEFLRYRWAEDRWYYQSIAGELAIHPGDGRWVLHMPGGYQQPWAHGLWPSLGRAFVAKEHAYLYRENYSGKLANPARVAYSPLGATPQEQRNFFAKLLAWGVNTVFGLPPGWDIKLIESNGRGYEIFKDTIDASDREFMIGLAGQVVTTTGGSGFANSDTFSAIRGDLIQGDGEALAATITQQGLAPIVNKLYGSSARATVAWDTRPPGDLRVQAEAISAAAKAIVEANAALEKYGMRINAEEITTRFSIPTSALATPSLDGLSAPALAPTPPSPTPPSPALRLLDAEAA
jgi:hypothetical protein